MSEKRYIVAGGFIDGSGGTVQRDVFLSIQDGCIDGIGRARDLPRQVGIPVVDFSHCTILPSLVDCSVFLLRSPSVDPLVRAAAAEFSPEQKAAMRAKHIHYCHTHGVLGVAINDDAAAFSDAFQGEISRENSMTIRRPPVDFLKIQYSSDIEDGDNISFLLEPGDISHLAHIRGDKKLVIIANGAQQVAEALAAGCDAVEQGYGMGGDNLKQMAEKNILWIPSLLRAKNGLDSVSGGGDVACRFSTRYVAPGKPEPGAETFWKKMLGEQVAQLRFAKELGVRTAIGTGAGKTGILHGESMVEEMKLFIKAGYSLAEAIQCASANGACFFGMDNLGALAVGKKATFLISRGTAQQLPRKLSYLEGIYIEGLPSPLYRKHPGRVL